MMDINEEGKDLLAKLILETVIRDVFKRLQPFKGKKKQIDSMNDISKACKEAYKHFSKATDDRMYNKWLKGFIAYLHDDFMNDMILYNEWEKEYGKRKTRRRQSEQ